MKNLRFILAVLFAPISAPLIVLLLGLITGSITNLAEMIFVVIISALVSYAGALFFGLPMILFLRRKSWLNYTKLFVAGAVLGGVVAFIMGWFFIGSLALAAKQFGWRDAANGGLFGVIVALSFGAIAGKSNRESRPVDVQ